MDATRPNGYQPTDNGVASRETHAGAQQSSQQQPGANPPVDTTDRRDEASGEQQLDDTSQAAKKARTFRGPLSVDVMKAHIKNNVFIGYKPGDPSAPPPLDELPEAQVAIPREAQLIRLADWSHDRLMAEAASTQGIDHASVLLPNPPGVPPERLAYFSGQAPAKEKLKPVVKHPASRTDSASAPPTLPPASLAALTEYLNAPNGALPVPWAALGVDDPPQIDGHDLSLLELWSLVSQRGGAAKAGDSFWIGIASILGFQGSPGVQWMETGKQVREWYTAYLLPYERWLKEKGE